MIRFIPLLLWLILAAASIGCSGPAQIDLGE